MILFTILLCGIIALVVVTALIVLTGGTMFMLIAGDLIVCIAIFYALFKRKKRSSQGLFPFDCYEVIDAQNKQLLLWT